MMPASEHKVIPAAQPTKVFFDPYNSSSTGHQRAPNTLSGSTCWRESRSFKLSHQFGDSSGRGGDEHLSDLVGAGSENWQKDGRKANGDWSNSAPGLREEGWQDIRTLLRGSRKRSIYDGKLDCGTPPSKWQKGVKERIEPMYEDVPPSHPPSAMKESCEELPQNSKLEIECDSRSKPPQIFRGLSIYLNGSTAPLVSDHKLKQLFTTHGGNTRLALGRRSVTHVILGKDCRTGLTTSKINKEVSTVRGKSIKFVTAQWVLDSVEKGIRQPEGRYRPGSISGRIGGSGQGSVATMFGGG